MCLVRNTRTERGTYMLAADATNKVLYVQWLDSKVVGLVTTLNTTKIGTVKRQVGKDSKEITCPEAVMNYQRTMFGVDKGDQIRVHGGGFSNKAHFKKWYKKTYLAILDCMLMNAYIAWNLAAKEDKGKKPLSRHKFMNIVANQFMKYIDDNEPEDTGTPQSRQDASSWTQEHIMESLPPKVVERCAVCRLETNMNKSLGQANLAKHVFMCSKCKIPAHPAVPTNSNRQIHQLEQFKGLSCFAILHSDGGNSIWTRRPEGQNPRYTVNFSSPIVQELRSYHGLSRTQKRKRRSSGGSGESDEE